MSDKEAQAIVLNQEQKQTLANAVKEGVNSMFRSQAERDLVKEIANKVKDEMKIPPTKFRKLVKNAYENSFNKLNDETTDILDLAEELNLYSHVS